MKAILQSIANASVDYHRKKQKVKVDSLDKAIIPENMNEKGCLTNYFRLRNISGSKYY